MQRKREQRQPRVLLLVPEPAAGSFATTQGDDTKSSGVVRTLFIFFLKLQEHSLIGNATTPGKPQQGRYSHRYVHRDPCLVIGVIFWTDAILGN